MQGIQARQPKDEEDVAADASGGNFVAIFPEENETADTPENLHAIEAISIKETQQGIERLLGNNEIGRRAADEFKMLIVKHQHCDGTQKPEQFDAEYFVFWRCERGNRAVVFDDASVQVRHDIGRWPFRLHRSVAAASRLASQIV